jgi:hypothetical protein
MDEMQQSRLTMALMIDKLSDGLGKQNEAIVAALTAPKKIVKDSQGRPVGVETQVNA